MTSSIQPMDSSNTPSFVIDAGEAYTPPQFTDQDHCGITQSSFSDLHTEHFAKCSTPYYVALVKNKNKGSALFDLTGFVNWDHSQSKFISPMGNAIIDRVTILGINALKTVTKVAECTSKDDFQGKRTQYVPQEEITSSILDPEGLLEAQVVIDRALRGAAREVSAFFLGAGGMLGAGMFGNFGNLLGVVSTAAAYLGSVGFERWKWLGQEENRRIKDLARLVVAFGGTALGAFMTGGSVLTGVAIQGVVEIVKEVTLPRVETMLDREDAREDIFRRAQRVNSCW